MYQEASTQLNGTSDQQIVSKQQLGDITPQLDDITDGTPRCLPQLDDTTKGSPRCLNDNSNDSPEGLPRCLRLFDIFPNSPRGLPLGFKKLDDIYGSPTGPVIYNSPTTPLHLQRTRMQPKLLNDSPMKCHDPPPPPQTSRSPKIRRLLPVPQKVSSSR